jgi:putative DNA primase/helicase
MMVQTYFEDPKKLRLWLGTLQASKDNRKPQMFPWLNHHTVAAVCLAELYDGLSTGTLWLYRGELWQYDGKAYVKTSTPRVAQDVIHWLNENGDPRPTADRAAKIVDAMMSWVDIGRHNGHKLKSLPNMPFWLTGDSTQYLHFQNGLVNLDKLLNTGDAAVEPHDPTYFSAKGFPYGYNPSAECPLWDDHLNLIFEGDLDRVALLQEWFGYCLVPDNRFQKALFMEGDGGNGKTVCEKVLIHLVGPARVSTVGLADLGKEFSLMLTPGKLVNICGDLGKVGKDAEVVFKQITGGEHIQMGRKFLSPLQIALDMRFLVSMNNLPSLKDRSNALWRRIIIVPFNVAIPDEIRKPVYTEDGSPDWPFRPELPGIFNWALKGLRRLYANRKFTEPVVCRMAHDEWVGDSDPIRRFLNVHYELDPDGTVPKDAMRARYLAATGHPINVVAFGKRVKHHFRRITDTRITVNDARITAWRGIRIKPHIEKQWAEDDAPPPQRRLT